MFAFVLICGLVVLSVVVMGGQSDGYEQDSEPPRQMPGPYGPNYGMQMPRRQRPRRPTFGARHGCKIEHEH